MPFDTPLVIEVWPSRRVLAWLGLLSCSTLAAVLSSGLPFSWRLALCGLVLAIAAREGREHWQQWKGARLAHDGRGGWTVLGDGGRREARLAAMALRGPGVLLLPVRIQGGRVRRWLLVRDMMDSENFRRLCVRAWMDSRTLDPGEDPRGRGTDAS